MNGLQVSVIIVSYNTRELLSGCLESLRRVQDELPFEVIVVDNDSADHSAEMVAADFPEVTLLRSDKNVGFASAINIALQHSTAPLVFILNPDALVARGTLAILYQFLLEDESRAVAGARITAADGRDLPSEFSIPSLFREFWNFLPELKSLIWNNPVMRALRRPHATREPREASAVSGAAFMVRRSALERARGMDGEFFLYHEELDLCARLRQQNQSVWTIPAAQVIHFDAQASGYSIRKLPDSPILDYRVLGMDRLWMKHRTRAQRIRWNRMARRLLHLRIACLALSRLAASGESRRRKSGRIRDLRGLIQQLSDRLMSA